MTTANFAIAVLIVCSTSAFSQVTDDSHRIRNGTRYKNTLRVFREPEIFPTRNPDSESYRLFLTATFYHPLIVRVERNRGRYRLEAKWLSGQVGYNWGRFKGRKSRRLTQKEWLTLKTLLDDAAFWSLPYEEKQPEPNPNGEITVCLDGVGWFLEGSFEKKYHVAYRYCPDEGPFKAAGTYIVKLAQLRFRLRLG